MGAAQAEDRFWALVERRGEKDCWEWRGGLNQHGYGSFWFNGGSIMAHRFSYLLAHNELPVGKSVCHSCDNPPCVNPAHLWVGTRADNKNDSVRKGRHARGASCGRSRLTSEQVTIIRHTSRKTTELAKSFGVARSTIRRVRAGLTWKCELSA